MKRIALSIVLCILGVSLVAAQIGKIRFFTGEVQYRASQNQAYKPATINLSVSEEGYLKTGPDSSVEILWTNGITSTVNASSQVNVKKLMEEACSKQNWMNKLENKVGNLKLQNIKRASSTAGIRRDEAEVQKDSLLFWVLDPQQDINEAIDLFDLKQYAKAAPLFEKVVTQAPLKKDAELAHAYLILIYNTLGEKASMQKHVQALTQDFPNSTTLDSLPAD